MAERPMRSRGIVGCSFVAVWNEGASRVWLRMVEPFDCVSDMGLWLWHYAPLSASLP